MFQSQDVIDVADGRFSWPVTYPSKGAESPDYYYSLNFSLVGNGDVFDVLPPFKIHTLSGDSDNKHWRNNNTAIDSGDDSDNGHHNDGVGLTYKPVSDKPTSQRQNTLVSNLLSSTTSATVPREDVPTSSRSDEGVADTRASTLPSNTMSASPSPSPSSRLPSDPMISNGAIAGIVTGALVALAVFGSLIGLVAYYRRRLLGGKQPFSFEKTRGSVVDGIFRKAELSTEEQGIRITRIHELDATRKIQEADRIMKPVELEAVAAISESPAAGVACHGTFTDDSDNLASKAKASVTALDLHVIENK